MPRRREKWPASGYRLLTFSGLCHGPGRAPADGRGHVTCDRLEDPGVVFDAELVRHGEQDRIGCLDRLVRGEFGGELVWFPDVGAAEPGLYSLQEANLVVMALVAELAAVDVLGDRQHAAGH